MSLMIVTRTVIFAFAVICLAVSVNAQTSSVPNKWNQVTACGFSFLLPETLQQEKSRGKDSCIARFEDNDMHIFLDYGRYSRPESQQGWMKDYENVPIMIAGRKANVITYAQKDAESGEGFPYVTNIHMRNEPSENSLRIRISTKSSADPNLVKRIYESVKFLGK